MPLIQWSSTYSVQVNAMDAQHQKLIGMINDLHDAMMQRKAKEVTGKIIQGLLSYTKEHFGEEERLMTQTQYPGLEEQKKQHKIFIDKIIQFQADLASDKLSLSMDISKFLKEWLMNHIQTVDKKYGPHLNAKGVK